MGKKNETNKNGKKKNSGITEKHSQQEQPTQQPPKEGPIKRFFKWMGNFLSTNPFIALPLFTAVVNALIMLIKMLTGAGQAPVYMTDSLTGLNVQLKNQPSVEQNVEAAKLMREEGLSNVEALNEVSPEAFMKNKKKKR